MFKHILTTIIITIISLACSMESGIAATKKHALKKPNHQIHHTIVKKPKTILKKKSPTKKTRHTKSKSKPLTQHHRVIKKTKQHQHPSKHSIQSHSSQRTQINTSNLHHTTLPAYLLSPAEKNLVNFVRNTVASAHHSAYKLGGSQIDTTRGIYVVDCSTYVDHILKTVYPSAYTSLVFSSRTEKPTTHNFYEYFSKLSDNSKHWNTIEDVEALRPGDILVFRYTNKSGNETGGHVMIVMDKPVRQGNTYLVRIADSAATGHSKDTRLSHRSGIGIGSILLKVDPQSLQPYAYSWKIGSRFESNVYFAMARPLILNS